MLGNHEPPMMTLQEQLIKIPCQNFLHADRYNTDDMLMLHLWDDQGNSYDIATKK